MVKVLVTGTHFTPAQAVIAKLKKEYKSEIVYVGRQNTREGDPSESSESQYFKENGIKFISLFSGRLQKSFTLYTIPSLLKIPVGLIQAFWILITEKPNVVLAFGGYISIPVVIAAWLLSIPIIYHEQTLINGLSSEICAIFADKIAFSFNLETNNLIRKFSNKSLITGLPIREEVVKKNNKPDPNIIEFINKSKKEKYPLIYITGGNQGAHIINEKIKEILPDLIKNYYVIHQTGDSKYKDFENLSRYSESLNHHRYFLAKWFNSSSLFYIYKNIKLAITRAGINTLSELANSKVYSIFIPYPYLYKNEQLINAKYFNSLGYGEILMQENLTSLSLLKLIKESIKKQPELSQSKIFKITHDADSRVALETILLASKQ